MKNQILHLNHFRYSTALEHALNAIIRYNSCAYAIYWALKRASQKRIKKIITIAITTTVTTTLLHHGRAPPHPLLLSHHLHHLIHMGAAMEAVIPETRFGQTIVNSIKTALMLLMETIGFTSTSKTTSYF